MRVCVQSSAAQPWRLRKHAEYQQIYKLSRKQQSPSMSYFAAVRPATMSWPVARVGLTAGRVLGNAVERNRIKRRMREAVRTQRHLLPRHVDVILHPRRTVLEIPFSALVLEVGRIFSAVAVRLVEGGLSKPGV